MVLMKHTKVIRATIFARIVVKNYNKRRTEKMKFCPVHKRYQFKTDGPWRDKTDNITVFRHRQIFPDHCDKCREGMKRNGKK